MSSPAVLDIDSLVQPIPGGSDAGPPADDVRDQLERLRRDPDALAESGAGRSPVWAKIIQIATDTLATKSKDLFVATRLLEAATRKEGAAGLRDGLRLLHRLAAEAWDRTHPGPPDTEPQDRGYLFEPLNDNTPSQPDKPRKFLEVVREIPLVQPDGRAITYLDWLQPARRAEVEEYLPKTDPRQLRSAYEDLTAARQALADLSAELDKRLTEAPNFLGEDTVNLGSVIGECLGLVKELAQRRGVPLTDAPAGEQPATAGDQPGAATAVAGPVGVAGTREGLYHQLGQIAAALKHIEPHSPIPFLLERCVKLGALPFPDLMRAIISDTTVLDALDQLIGAPKKE